MLEVDTENNDYVYKKANVPLRKCSERLRLTRMMHRYWLQCLSFKMVAPLILLVIVPHRI